MLRGHLIKDKKANLLQHILNFHDGEAKVVYERAWAPLPDDVDIHNPALWQYQTSKSKAARQWLFQRAEIAENRDYSQMDLGQRRGG